ncbi:MAG: stalk domain-containing protein [Syntrophomonadales bacterium]|jgi:hypothetical protein
MKKTIAVLLSMVMLLGIGTIALAANSDNTTLPDKSTYEFRFEVPDNIIPNEDTVVPVTFKTLTLGAGGYDNVRFEIVNTVAPGSGTVSFQAKDTAGRNISFNNYGIFAPSENFALPAQYNATTDWTLNFSEGGSYVINIKAYDGSHNKIAEGSQQITVAEGSFQCTFPAEVLVGEEITANVTFVTDQDYNDVHFEFAKTAGSGDILFKAQDSNNVTYTFVNSGTWGNDFDITAPYNVTTPWKLTFSKADSYTIDFKLVNQDGDVLVQESQDVTVKESASNEEEDEDEDKDDDGNIKCNGNTHGLMNALINHLKAKKNGNQKARAKSTARLLELLQQRGVSVEELKALVEELEKEIAKNDATDEDYKALSRMYKLKGEKHKTYINGKKVKYDVEPIVENGRTLVPFRKLAEELGADVKWVDSEKKVIVTKGKTTIILVLGQITATIDENNNKKTTTLDVPAKLHNNRTMVPLRFVSEALKATVDYYPEGALVVINTKHK